MSISRTIEGIEQKQSRLNRLIERFVNKESEVQLSFNEIMSLYHIVEAKDAASTSQLSKVLNMGNPQVSNLLKKLEQKKLIKRKNDRGDRRKVVIKPSSVAVDICNIVSKSEDMINEVLSSELTNNEVKHLQNVLDKMDGILSKVSDTLE